MSFSFNLIVVLVILTVTLGFFVSNRLRLDLIAMVSLLALVFAGAVSVDEALAGFSNQLVLMIAGLFVVGGALFRTGVADAMGRWVQRMAGAGTARLIVVLMAVTALLSAFLSSTGTVAVMLPVVIAIARGRNISPAVLLMPLAFASLLGGMLTLIGTPPNLIVSNQLIQAGFQPFGFFAFAGPGLVMLVIGIVFMALAGTWFSKPSQQAEVTDAGPGWFDLFTEYGLANNLALLRVPARSALAGQAVNAAGLRPRFYVTVLAIASSGRQGRLVRRTESGSLIYAGDELYLSGAPDRIREVAAEFGLELLEWHPILPAPLRLVDALVPPRSSWIGKTLRELRLHSEAGVTVLAQRVAGGEAQTVDLDRNLEEGDVLLATGRLKALRNVTRGSRDLVLLGSEGLTQSPRKKLAPVAIAVMLLMLAAMTFNWLPNVIAVLAAACALLLTRCLTVEEAYRNINWESVVLIAAILPMATALDNTGGLKLASDALLALSGDYGPLVILAMLFLFTSTLSMMVSNTATAVLVAPVAVQTAIMMELSPYPFLMTVAIAASTAFATPVASPVNTLVLNPGGYTFSDFVRVGIPLQVLILAATLVVVPRMFPL